MSVTDEWSTPTLHRQDPTANESPSKRASRHNRISNDVEHSSFVRTITPAAEDDDLASSTEYRIGDAVIVDGSVKLKQKFLHPPLYQFDPAATRTTAKGRSKKQQTDVAAAYEGWKHEDGLAAGDKVGVITRLYEDVRGVKMALVRWFARPGAVWGPEGPEDDELGGKTLPYELYYTADSCHLSEQRQIEQRALERQSPSKRGNGALSYISSVASLKTPLHSDAVPVSTISRLAEILSPVPASGPDDGSQNLAITARTQSICPTFVVRRVYDVKPIPGASFWSDLVPAPIPVATTEKGKEKASANDALGGWEELRRRGIAGWSSVTEGSGDHKARGWDVEPEMEVESEEDEVVVRRRKAEKKKKENKEKGRATRDKVPLSEVVGDESESDEDDDEPGETFVSPSSWVSSLPSVRNLILQQQRPERAFDASSDEDDDDKGQATSADDATSDEDDPSDSDEDAEYDRPRCSPSKRRSVQSTGNRRRAATSKSPTKKRLQPVSSVRPAKRRKITKDASQSSTHNPLPPLLSATYLASLPTPLERAKALLHVSATPESLPCREEQRSRIRQFVEDAVLSRSGGCLYVHGVPGTGKTATVHSVVRELQNDPDMDTFTFVEINGMKISEPNAAFSHLWNALNTTASSMARMATTTNKSAKISPKAALAALEGWFANPDPARKTTVVLVDELDQMLTKRQEVLYNFFNWPHSAHSRLVVIAVANTMDLPERELNGKIRSRLGTNRIPFQPYTWNELKRILEARLSLVTSSSDPTAPVRIFEDTALQKIAKSVAGISGDARKALDVARRTLDRVALRTPAAADTAERVIKCTIADATAAYNEMTRSGPGVFIKGLSLHQKVLLLALAQCIRRAGVPEVELDAVLTWHDTFLRQTHLVPPSSFPSKSDLATLIAELHSMRLVATESQRLDVFQRVRAGVEEGDVFAALREDELLKNHVPQA
ncbi:hypothetical protein JCM11491_001748 [Sporobolomyces phaffii]